MQLTAIFLAGCILLNASTVPGGIARAGADETAQVYISYIADKPLLTPCGLSEEALQNALKGRLKELAGVFLEAEEKTGVNALFLAAVAALESGWGESKAAREKNNLFGWTGQNGYQQFESRKDCILTVAQRLRDLYLTPGGRYFHGYTVEAVNRCYNGRPEWETAIVGIMENIHGVGE